MRVRDHTARTECVAARACDAACDVDGVSTGKHRLMLMTVLETLIYDPLVDWKTTKRGKGKENIDVGELEVRVRGRCSVRC
jgi:hypothetical protein